MIRSSKTKCLVCKEIVEQSGKGRPSEYHPICRRLENLLSWLENIIGALPKTQKVKTYVRSRLMTILNLTNNFKGE